MGCRQGQSSLSSDRHQRAIRQARLVFPAPPSPQISRALGKRPNALARSSARRQLGARLAGKNNGRFKCR